MQYTGCYVELTSDCNLSCKHCALNKERSVYQLPLDKIKETLCFLTTTGLRCVYLSGGEPLLYDHFRDVCEFLSLQDRIEWEIVTNGTLLSDETCVFLKKQHGLRRINLSLDGATATTHDFNRGIGTFDSVIRAVQLLKKHGFENRINIQMVLAKYNLHEIGEFQRLAESYNISYKFIRLSKLGQAKKNADVLVLDDAALNDTSATVQKTNNKEDIAYSCPLIKSDHKATLYIDYFGNVFLCKKLRHTNRKIGNINSQIIDKDMLNDLLQDILAYSKDLSTCESCAIKAYCKKGCFAKALLYNLPNDGGCRERVSFFSKKLLEHIRKDASR